MLCICIQISKAPNPQEERYPLPRIKLVVFVIDAVSWVQCCHKPSSCSLFHLSLTFSHLELSSFLFIRPSQPLSHDLDPVVFLCVRVIVCLMHCLETLDQQLHYSLVLLVCASRKSMSEYDPRLVAPTCLYLASKAEESTVQAKVLVFCIKRICNHLSMDLIDQFVESSNFSWA